MGAPPPQRSAGGSSGAGERHAEERCGSSPPCYSPHCLLPSWCRCAARPPAVEECTDTPASPAGCPGGRQPGGATRGAGSAPYRGRRRGAKKSLFAPGARWLVFTDLVLLPGAANAASQRPERWRSCASSHLVVYEFTQTCAVMAGTCCLCVAALLRVAIVPAASLPVAVKGRHWKTLSSLLFNTLYVSTHVPRGYRCGRGPWRRLASRAGNSRSAPPLGALAPYPKSSCRTKSVHLVFRIFGTHRLGPFKVVGRAPTAEFRQLERHNVDRPESVGLPAECRAKRWWHGPTGHFFTKTRNKNLFSTATEPISTRPPWLQPATPPSRLYSRV